MNKDSIFAGAKFGDSYMTYLGHNAIFINEVDDNYVNVLIENDDIYKCGYLRPRLIDKKNGTSQSSIDYIISRKTDDKSINNHSDGYERGITDTINWIYQNLALDEPIPEKMIKDELLNKKKVQPKSIDELWNEWRFTNEWKSACQFTTFEKFLDDKGIPYVK